MEQVTTKEAEIPDNGSKLPIFIGISVFMLVLIAVFGFVFAKTLNFNKGGYDLSLPIKGEVLTITDYQCYWREVQDSDKVQIGVNYIPVVELNFSKDTEGELIIYFENNNLETVGDGKRLKLQKGEFSSKESPFQISSTAGYAEKSAYRGYVYSEPPYWSLVIKEVVNGKVGDILTKIPLPSMD
ncbi:hypothetical protein OAB00_03610 [Akkermansiaceae bacterium]|nr:hypothetical protein [Akkermansiaceae bacterium]